jgi:EAL domain-containing protein (putative c-di-GMP-specific phosphodiesterase class I)
MQEPLTGTAWLERDAQPGGIERSYLRSFPFSIGRIDEADLCVDSQKVSRKHAVIMQDGKTYRVQDLKSTNGTFLNGERIDDAMLSDGDQLAFAGAMFTFFSGAYEAGRQVATQVISQPQESTDHWVREAILAIRRMHEVVTCRGVETLFQPIVELATRETLGYEALASSGGGDEGHPRCEQWIKGVDCRALDRVRYLFLHLALEDAASLPRGRLFLAVSTAESIEPSLVDRLCQLRDRVGNSRQLVIEIPDSAARSTATSRELLARLREVRFEVAYDGYKSSVAEIAGHKDVTPDFFKFSASLFKSIQWSKERQRQVQLIVQASRDNGSEVIATGIDSEADLKVCLDLGCSFAQGSLFGNPFLPLAQLQTSRRGLPAGVPAQ